MQFNVAVKITPNTDLLLHHFGETAEPYVVAGMEATMQVAEAEVVHNTPVDQGTLRASAHGTVVTQWPQVVGHLGSPLVYAEAVEYGSKPHWPPTAPIEGWVRRKFGYSGAQMIRVAFLVRRAISRRGTPPHLMFYKGLRVGLAYAPRFLAASLRQLEQRLSDR